MTVLVVVFRDWDRVDLDIVAGDDCLGGVKDTEAAAVGVNIARIASRWVAATDHTVITLVGFVTPQENSAAVTEVNAH